MKKFSLILLILALTQTLQTYAAPQAGGVTAAAVKSAGFKVIEANYFSDAERWWRDELCMKSDYGKHIDLMLKSGWLSFGYVVAVKE